MANGVTLAPAHASVSFGDLFTYISVIAEVISLFKNAGHLAVGASEPVPAIKVVVGGHHYTWEHDTLTRTA